MDVENQRLIDYLRIEEPHLQLIGNDLGINFGCFLRSHFVSNEVLLVCDLRGELWRRRGEALEELENDGLWVVCLEQILGELAKERGICEFTAHLLDLLVEALHLASPRLEGGCAFVRPLDALEGDVGLLLNSEKIVEVGPVEEADVDPCFACSASSA